MKGEQQDLSIADIPLGMGFKKPSNRTVRASTSSPFPIFQICNLVDGKCTRCAIAKAARVYSIIPPCHETCQSYSKLRTKKDLETLELNLEVPFAVIDRDVLAKCRSVQQHHETKVLFAKLSTTADRPVIYQ